MPAVLVCWGAWTALKAEYYSNIDFRLDLHIDEYVGTAGHMYTPSSHRGRWGDVSVDKEVITRLKQKLQLLLWIIMSLLPVYVCMRACVCVCMF